MFLSPDWRKLSEMLRILNTCVGKYVRRNYPKKAKNKADLFEPIRYKVVETLDHLFVLGRYVYVNPLYLKDLDRPIPHSCFWMFESGNLKGPYREEVYVSLFGLGSKELFDIYSKWTARQVKEYALAHFGGKALERRAR